MKKSGLADSPFFKLVENKEDVEKHPNKLNGRAKAQMHESINAQTHERAKARMHENTYVQDYRSIVRRTYDIFLDQVDKIDEQVILRRRKLGKSVTKGSIVREIIDDYFKKNPTEQTS